MLRCVELLSVKKKKKKKKKSPVVMFSWVVNDTRTRHSVDGTRTRHPVVGS